jgi:flagellar protein FliO/FliZ
VTERCWTARLWAVRPWAGCRAAPLLGLAALGGALALLPGEAGALAVRASLTALAAVALAALARRRTVAAPRAALRVTAQAPLGRAATVALVEVDGRRFLVGAGDRTLELLAELAPAAEEAP